MNYVTRIPSWTASEECIPSWTTSLGSLLELRRKRVSLHERHHKTCFPSWTTSQVWLPLMNCVTNLSLIVSWSHVCIPPGLYPSMDCVGLRDSFASRPPQTRSQVCIPSWTVCTFYINLCKSDQKCRVVSLGESTKGTPRWRITAMSSLKEYPWISWEIGWCWGGRRNSIRLHASIQEVLDRF